MKRRDVLRYGAMAGLWSLLRPGSASAAASRPRVVFLNPGEAAEHETGTHWQLVSRMMAAAAAQFGMDLEVRYAERDHLLMLRQAEEVARRAGAPNYIVIVNEKMTAAQMLRILARSPAKVLVIHNDLTVEQRREVGNERERIGNWIGTLTADAERGGFRLMRYLCRLHGREQAHVIGITGDPNTPVSIERAAGVETYLAQSGCGATRQLVFGDWSFGDGRDKARVLLARYPEADIIWAANDTMTLGAAQAVKDAGAHVLVGGMGALEQAVRSVADGGMAAIVAGDQFIGAYAMVLLYDYHHGADFRERGGARQKLDFLRVLHRDNADQYRRAVFAADTPPDFGEYSHFRHRDTQGYEFDCLRQLRIASGLT